MVRKKLHLYYPHVTRSINIKEAATKTVEKIKIVGTEEEKNKVI